MTLKLNRQPQKVKRRRVTLDENWLLPLLNGLVLLAFVNAASHYVTPALRRKLSDMVRLTRTLPRWSTTWPDPIRWIRPWYWR